MRVALSIWVASIFLLGLVAGMKLDAMLVDAARAGALLTQEGR